MQSRFSARRLTSRAHARRLLLGLALALPTANSAAACAPPPEQQQQQPAAQAQAQQSPAPPQQQPAAAKPPQSRTPTDTVREFYRNLRERRFREAFAMSIWRPAVEGLSAEDFEELRPEFEKFAAGMPESIETTGEQISGDEATVFARLAGDPSGKTDAHPVLRVGGVWVYGNRESQQAVNRDGKDFFFKARIETHHAEVQSVLQRIAEAEALYASTHGGRYADLPTLTRESQLSFREEMRLAESLGYNFRVTLGDGGRSYRVNAEPQRYGRTGKLSFVWQDGVLQRKDTGGKPYNPPPPKRR
jgi:hypothetical protein